MATAISTASDERQAQRCGRAVEQRRRARSGRLRRPSSGMRSTRGRTAWTPAGGRAEPDRQPDHHSDREEHHATTVPSPPAPKADHYGRPHGRPHLRRRCATTCATTSPCSPSIARSAATRCRGRSCASCARALAAAKADDDVRVVVLTGAGTKAFCAGADLDGMAGGAGFTELHEGRGELADLFRDLYALGKPTIAQVRGYALGRRLRAGPGVRPRRRRRRRRVRHARDRPRAVAAHDHRAAGAIDAAEAGASS